MLSTRRSVARGPRVVGVPLCHVQTGGTQVLRDVHHPYDPCKQSVTGKEPTRYIQSESYNESDSSKENSKQSGNSDEHIIGMALVRNLQVHNYGLKVED